MKNPWHLNIKILDLTWVSFEELRFFLNIEASVDDEQSFDGQKQTTLSIFAHHKVKFRYPLLW